MTSLRAFMHLVSEAPRGRVVTLLVLMILAGLSEGMGILLLVPLLGILQNGNESRNAMIQAVVDGIQAVGLPISLTGLLAAFLILVAFRSAVQYARERLGASLQHNLVDRLRQRCFAALLGAEWRWIAAGRKADHANMLLTDVGRVGVGLNFGLSLLASLATMLAYVLAAFALSWAIASLALVSGGLVLFALSGQRRQALRLGQGLGVANRAMQGNVQESLAGIKLAKILGSEQRHLRMFHEATRQLRRQQLQFQASTSLSRAVFQFGGAALLTGYLYVGLNLWHTPLPELVTLVLVFGRLIPMFASVQQQYHHCLHALPALQETHRLLADCDRFAEPKGPVDISPWPVHEAICLKDVAIRYADRDRPALDAVSLCFRSRTTTAIMGASGAGKSTLADVLMGLLTTDEGRLLVDGKPVDGLERMRWRHSVAYVPQEVFLFHDSVRNNLLWGRADADDADLRQALQRAAADFVFDLPLGLDTVVGDGGTRLSGGERQRLALARALLKRPSLLILDEATSALDLDNEARVREAIEHLHGDLTVVIVGHRLPTLEHADQVVILDRGRIAAQGTWAEVGAMNRAP